MENDADRPEPGSEDQAARAALDTVPGATTDASGEELERLRGELEAANDRALRARAELDNVRKRARRELEDEQKYAQLPLLRDLLPVMDNLQRAIAAAEQGGEAGSLLDGIKLVAQSLDGVLSQWHCRKIEALRQPFDPRVHEAVAQVPSAEQPPHTVMQVVQDGFTLHERVVRPAQVIVSSAPAES